MKPGELYKKESGDDCIEWHYILSNEYSAYALDDGHSLEIVCPCSDGLRRYDAEAKLCDQSALSEFDALIFSQIKKAIRKKYESSQKFVEVIDALKLELQKQEFKKARDAGKEA